MHEMSGSQFLKAFTKIYQIPFRKEISVLRFLTNLGVAGISCIFRLVIGGKAGKRYLSQQNDSP